MKKKPLCVDCGKKPQLQYCRCWECLKEYEKRTHLINSMNPNFSVVKDVR